MRKGFGKQVLALSDEAGVPLAETQKDLTPLQRNVLMLQLKEKQEETERRTNQNGRSPNPARKPHGGGGGETTTYVNEKYK